jgi:hypothetical protein
VEDFDIRLNMMTYFIPRDGSSSLHYTQLVSCGKGKASAFANQASSNGIEEWARSFCAVAASDKRYWSNDPLSGKLLNLCEFRFIITRKLTNWDSETIIGRIHGLVQHLNYKGQISVTVPVSHSRTVIKTTESFSAVLRSHFIPAEKWEVDVFWPYASHPAGEDSDGDHSSPRKCLVRTENGWFKDWRPTLRAAILNKKKGWVGLDDWIEHSMRPIKPEGRPFAWGESR